MGLVAIEEVETEITPSCLTALRKDGVFAAVEKKAAILIRDRTGLAIPESPNDRAESADWSVLASAWIIQYIVSAQVSNLNPELSKAIRDKYTDALKILDAHPAEQKKSDGSQQIVTLGEIEGMYT